MNLSANSLHVIVALTGDCLKWIACLRSLRAQPKIAAISVIVPSDAPNQEFLDRVEGVVVVRPPDALSVINANAHLSTTMAFVFAPVMLPESAFLPCLDFVKREPRCFSVSFLSNAAGYLSFPYRNNETPILPQGHDAGSLTFLLRQRVPAAKPVSIAVADGPVVVLASDVYLLMGGLTLEADTPLNFSVIALTLRTRDRGFQNYLDPSTVISCPLETSDIGLSVLEQRPLRHRLHVKHKYFPGFYDSEKLSTNSMLSMNLDLARAKAFGLSVLLDGSSLGPQEMGTQVQTVQLAAALAAHKDVREIVIGVPEVSRLPDYCQQLRSERKLRFINADGLRFEAAGTVDILHRPFQPSEGIPWDRWRGISRRVAITIQDLIAYRNGAYFHFWHNWQNYREMFHEHVRQADGIVAISKDVVGTIEEEGLPVDTARISVVENGIDNAGLRIPQRIPPRYAQRFGTGQPFVLVLGTDYFHKNRDQAVKIWSGLRDRGHQHALVLAGASVPFGSTRVDESLAIPQEHMDRTIYLPDVTSGERNWLLANADLVIYPTSAEGFGFIPYEAAQMGRPTLFVSFGPLGELIGDASEVGRFDLAQLINEAERLLTDQVAGKLSVKTIMDKIGELSWTAAADKYVDFYFRLMSMPRN